MIAGGWSLVDDDWWMMENSICCGCRFLCCSGSLSSTVNSRMFRLAELSTSGSDFFLVSLLHCLVHQGIFGCWEILTPIFCGLSFSSASGCLWMLRDPDPNFLWALFSSACSCLQALLLDASTSQVLVLMASALWSCLQMSWSAARVSKLASFLSLVLHRERERETVRALPVRNCFGKPSTSLQKTVAFWG